jgi:hypothetical protein
MPTLMIVQVELERRVRGSELNDDTFFLRSIRSQPSVAFPLPPLATPPPSHDPRQAGFVMGFERHDPVYVEIKKPASPRFQL